MGVEPKIGTVQDWKSWYGCRLDQNLTQRSLALDPKKHVHIEAWNKRKQSIYIYGRWTKNRGKTPKMYGGL